MHFVVKSSWLCFARVVIQEEQKLNFKRKRNLDGQLKQNLPDLVVFDSFLNMMLRRLLFCSSCCCFSCLAPALCIQFNCNSAPFHAPSISKKKKKQKKTLSSCYSFTHLINGLILRRPATHHPHNKGPAATSYLARRKTNSIFRRLFRTEVKGHPKIAQLECVINGLILRPATYVHHNMG